MRPCLNVTPPHARYRVRATWEAARASVAAAQGKVSQAGITLSYTEVRAPISGITSMEVSSEGSLVNPTDPSGLLTTITQLDPLYVNFSIAGTLDYFLRDYVATHAAAVADHS